MSFLVDKLAKHAGDLVADKIKSSLGGGDDKDDDKDKKDKDGGFLSIFKRDKEEDDHDDDHKGGLFSFGKDKDKKKDKEHGNFFDKLFNRDDDDDDDDDDDRERVHKRSGFAGLFSEQDQQGGGEPEDRPPECGPCDHMSEGDLDLMSDLMEVANETP